MAGGENHGRDVAQDEYPFGRPHVLTVIIAALVLWCHRENIQRLLRGQERKFHWHTGPEK
mgnify:FL=1